MKDRASEPAGEGTRGRAAADASEMTEGVGGLPDLEEEERATISDIDGDNVETERPKPEA